MPDLPSLILASIIRSSDDAIVTKTREGIITSWNPAAERLFGYPPDEAIGRPITILFPADRLREEEEFRRRIHAGQRVEHFETVRVRKDGSHVNISATLSPIDRGRRDRRHLEDRPRHHGAEEGRGAASRPRTAAYNSGDRVHVSVTLSPIRNEDGEIIGVSKIARDITERVKLAAREEAALRKAEEANRLKDEFLAMLSHELRTPLNSIYGWTRVLQNQALDAATTARALEVIERNCRAQLQLIAELLDVSRIVTGRVASRPPQSRAVGHRPRGGGQRPSHGGGEGHRPRGRLSARAPSGHR